MRKEGVVLLLLVFAVGAISLTSAFVYESNRIEKSYFSGERVRGDFRISFDQENNFSVLTSNLEGSVLLKDFLRDNDMDAGSDFYYNGTKIKSGNLSLDIGKANFFLKDEEEFVLYIDGKAVFNESINVSESFDFNIRPKFVLVGREAILRIVSAKNVSSSTWDFGDGSKESFEGEIARHTYTDRGSFEIVVDVKGKGNESSRRSFIIAVNNAEVSANLTIQEYRKSISDVKKQMGGFPLWARSEIESELGLNELNASLSLIEEDFNKANQTEDFSDVVDSLLGLDVPSNVSVMRSGTLPINIGFNNFDVSYIEFLSGEKVSESEVLELAIIDWFDKHYGGDVELEEISSWGSSGVNAIATKFKISLSEKQASSGAYLIIDYPLGELVFLKNYGEREVSGSGTAIPVSGSATIEFLASGVLNVEDLGAYVSPEVGEFNIDSREICEGDECPKGRFPFLWFSLGIFLVLSVTFVVYIALQEWYKKHYENHLFKNPDDLYNLINFIYNARASGLADKEIWKRLKDSKWSGEKIRYALRKMDGKRTGMFEIPLFKARENKKVEVEIARRHEGRVDPRFAGALRRTPRF